MPDSFEPGDVVLLVGIPDWLIHDLPEEERVRIKAAIGLQHTIQKVDKNGYFWLTVCEIHDDGATARTHGSTFCVPADFIELAPDAINN